MTISTTIIKNSYSGDGSNRTFTYGFKIADEDFIEVIVAVCPNLSFIEQLFLNLGVLKMLF